MHSQKFGSHGKKALHASNTVFEVALVDVSKPQIERPKKAKTALQR